MEASRCAYKRNIILNSIRQHNHFITEGNYKATCFDYRLVIQGNYKATCFDYRLVIQGNYKATCFDYRLVIQGNYRLHVSTID